MDDLEGTSSILHQALCLISKSLVNSNLSYSLKKVNSGQNRWIFAPYDLDIRWMTLKNNTAPLLCYFKLCALFGSHWLIQTGVTVRKRPIWVKINDFFFSHVNLKLDGWPLPFAWTSPLSLVITPENFMMIRWWEHGEKEMWLTDRQTDWGTSMAWNLFNNSKKWFYHRKTGFTTVYQFINQKTMLSIEKTVYQLIIQFPIDKWVFRLIIQFFGR